MILVGTSQYLFLTDHLKVILDVSDHTLLITAIQGISAAPSQDQSKQPYHDLLGTNFQTHNLQ
jgi:hypothetical protein